MHISTFTILIGLVFLHKSMLDQKNRFQGSFCNLNFFSENTNHICLVRNFINCERPKENTINSTMISHASSLKSETFQDYALLHFHSRNDGNIKKANAGLSRTEEYIFPLRHIDSLFIISYSGESFK